MATDLATGTAVAGPGDGAGALRRRLLSWDTAVVLVTVLVILWACATVESFATGQNAVFLTLDLAPLLLIALPMTLIIVTGEIDLSVASIVGLSSAVMGWLWNQGLTIETIIPLCMLLGALLGAVNGVFVTVFGLPSLAVTIGTLALFRGLAYVVLGDEAVADCPYTYTSWVTGTMGGTSIPNVTIPLVVLAAGVRRRPARHARRPLAVRHGRQRGGGPLRRHARPDGQVLAVRRVRRGLGARRRLLDAALLQRPRQQRGRPGARRRRVGAARRRLDLRRPRHALGRRRRRPAARHPAERAAPGGRVGRRAPGRHRAAAHRLGARAERRVRSPATPGPGIAGPAVPQHPH